MMYLECDSLHQIVMIVCKCIWSSYIITFHIMMYLCSLAKVSHITHILFATIVHIQCDLVITRNTYGSICSLNYPKLFWNKIWLDMFSVFWSRNALHLELSLCFFMFTMLFECLLWWLSWLHSSCGVSPPWNPLFRTLER